MPRYIIEIDFKLIKEIVVQKTYSTIERYIIKFLAIVSQNFSISQMRIKRNDLNSDFLVE